MVYNQERYKLALRVLKDSKPYRDSRGLKSDNLDVHLRKYDLRKPLLENAFLPRIGLWADRTTNNDDDEDYDPSQKKKRATKDDHELKSPRTKRRVVFSGDEKIETDTKKKRKQQKGTIWAKGRREGRTMKLTFKFTNDTENKNFDKLKELAHKHGTGAAIGPLAQVVNVFRTYGLDSAQRTELDGQWQSQMQLHGPLAIGGFGIDSSTSAVVKNGLLSPQSSVGSAADFNDFAFRSVNADLNFNPESTRSLRNGAILRSPRTPDFENKSRTGSYQPCCTAKKICFLLKSHTEYTGPCKGCVREGGESRIKFDWELRAQSINKVDVEVKEENSKGKEKAADWLHPSRSPHHSHSQGLSIAALLKNEELKLKGGTKNAAIEIDDSPSSPTSSTHTHPATPTTHLSTTSWAHPISFYHRPTHDTTAPACHFCTNYRYGVLGCGTLTNVEVVWSDSAFDDSGGMPPRGGYIEIEGGHVGRGKDPTRMCISCAMENLRVAICGSSDSHAREGEGVVLGGKYEGQGQGQGGHRFISMQNARNWASFENIDFPEWIKDLTKGTGVKPSHPMCRLCIMPAYWYCVRHQGRDDQFRIIETGTPDHTAFVVPAVVSGDRDGGLGTGGDGLEVNTNTKIGTEKVEERKEQPQEQPQDQSQSLKRKRLTNPTGRRGCGLVLCQGCKIVVENLEDGKWEKKTAVERMREGNPRVHVRADAEFLFKGSLLHRAWGEHLRMMGLSCDV